ncbi:hypothetical protein O6H91_10G065600 [Diphasiastrum complanatum]|uniref:Uncharacterized protein n=1 Tax=Diphasiastrum complanatum TaxID=34168 RepID=A0ACC2CHQ5_DIPCM|nr:hypothetical protein O6H91_10G065600 [Diphasiastrum complanatum]
MGKSYPLFNMRLLVIIVCVFGSSGNAGAWLLQQNHAFSEGKGTGCNSLLCSTTILEFLQDLDMPRRVLLNSQFQVPPKEPGSKPPQCRNGCGDCRGECVARPEYIQGGRSTGQHAIWTCMCQAF